MWPVLTLTFFLQLTDEEQLFAQQVDQSLIPQQQEQLVVPATGQPTGEEPAAWPEESQPTT